MQHQLRRQNKKLLACYPYPGVCGKQPSRATRGPSSCEATTSSSATLSVWTRTCMSHMNGGLVPGFATNQRSTPGVYVAVTSRLMLPDAMPSLVAPAVPMPPRPASSGGVMKSLFGSGSMSDPTQLQSLCMCARCAPQLVPNRLVLMSTDTLLSLSGMVRHSRAARQDVRGEGGGRSREGTAQGGAADETRGRAAAPRRRVRGAQYVALNSGGLNILNETHPRDVADGAVSSCV